ncbi:MAG: hypothetical protein ACYDEB_14240 [Dehalococcoidia bacterium]
MTTMHLAHTLPRPLKIRTHAFGPTSTPLGRIARGEYLGSVAQRVALHAVVLSMAAIVAVVVAY